MYYPVVNKAMLKPSIKLFVSLDCGFDGDCNDHFETKNSDDKKIKWQRKIHTFNFMDRKTAGSGFMVAELKYVCEISFHKLDFSF